MRRWRGKARRTSGRTESERLRRQHSSVPGFRVAAGYSVGRCVRRGPGGSSP